MIYPEINTLTSSLSCLPINKPIISYSTYIRNKLKDLDCDYWRVHTSDGYIEFDSRHFYGIFNHHKSNSILSSATTSKIVNITNKYIADKRIYISPLINNHYYYISSGNGKSLRELLSFTETFMDCSQNIRFTPYPYVYTLLPYPNEYKVYDYKSDMENLNKKIISEKILNSYETQKLY